MRLAPGVQFVERCELNLIEYRALRQVPGSDSFTEHQWVLLSGRSGYSSENAFPEAAGKDLTPST